MKENRACRRVPIVTRVETQSGGSPLIVVAQNISEGGMLLRAADPASEGDTLHLKFTLPGTEREIQVSGRVQHVSPGAFMGVRFEGLSGADLETIQRFVRTV